MIRTTWPNEILEGRLEQIVAAAPAAPALHEAMVLEVEQDLLEEFLGQVVALGDVGDQHRPSSPSSASTRRARRAYFAF